MAELQTAYKPAQDVENRRKHGVSLDLGQSVLDGATTTVIDDRFPYGEEGLLTFGYVRHVFTGALYTCVTKACGRSPSARRMHGSRRDMVERDDQAIPANPEWGPGNTWAVADASQRLRMARAVLGLTQAGMADLLGVPVATVRN